MLLDADGNHPFGITLLNTFIPNGWQVTLADDDYPWLASWV